MKDNRMSTVCKVHAYGVLSGSQLYSTVLRDSGSHNVGGHRPLSYANVFHLAFCCITFGGCLDDFAY